MYQVLNGHLIKLTTIVEFSLGWLAATTLMEMLAYNRGLIIVQYYSFLQSFQDFDYWLFYRGWLLNGSGSTVTVMYNQQ